MRNDERSLKNKATSPKEVAKDVSARTTVSSTARRPEVTEDQQPVAKAVIITPEEQPISLRLQSNENKPAVKTLDNFVFSDAAQRERRSELANRRGRALEKVPAGTRTKMLKIIYDRKADLEQRRRAKLAFKVIMTAVIAMIIVGFSGTLINSTYQLGNNLLKKVNLHSWYEQVARTTPPPPKKRAETVKSSSSSPRKNKPAAQRMTQQTSVNKKKHLPRAEVSRK